MKKRITIPLAIVGCLAISCLGLLLADITAKRSFDQLSRGYATAPPAREAQNIGVLIEGDYPGLSDEPVTAEGAAPGRAALDALRGQKYTRLLPFSRPAAGGVALREVSGCSSWCIAYWDGKHLWLPGEKDGHWRGCSPSSPKELEEALQDAYKLQKEIRG